MKLIPRMLETVIRWDSSKVDQCNANETISLSSYYNWLCNAKCSRSEKCYFSALNSWPFAFGDGPNQTDICELLEYEESFI
jgi:hypothetical protein